MLAPSHRLSIAPMMDYTDRHYRAFMRGISRHTELYTEMLTADAILHGDRDYLLGFSPIEQPLVLQLGGSDPTKLAECARIAEQWGYSAVNLNVGCPSDRVQAGRFGACLMREPQLVARCVSAMRDAVAIPVTVKTRLGIDDQDSYAFLRDFIEPVANAGCQQFILHARKAWLKGLSPKENRDVPPLCYDRVYQVKQDYPALDIIINGGIGDLPTATQQLNYVDGVMIGRAAYANPYLFATVDRDIYGDHSTPIPSRLAIAQAYLSYMATQLSKPHVRLRSLTRHMLGLFQGQPGAKIWRRRLSDYDKSADLTWVADTIAAVQSHRA